jgi:ribosomal protein L11 methyltransferase
MGFGTGHHATTRQCLRALQILDLDGASVLDVGTGSGILAIAARRLGAASAVGLDNDADAIQAALENLALNPDVQGVRYVVADLSVSPLPQADVVVANLTGVQLVRAAAALQDSLRSGGTLVAAGVLDSEEEDVRAAFDALEVCGRYQDDEWVCLTFNRGRSSLV